MSLFQLALANLRASRLASAVNVLLLALGTASIAVLLLASAQFSSALTENAAGIDLVIGAKGSPLQLVLAGVYHADVPPGNIPAAEVERWQSHPSVASAIPLSLGDSHRGYRIVGTVPDFATLYDAKIAQGELWHQPFEAVLGATVAETTGLKVGDTFAGVHGLADDGDVHDHAEYRIVGIFEPTKAVIDGLIVTSATSVWLMHSNHGHSETGHAHNAGHKTDSAEEPGEPVAGNDNPQEDHHSEHDDHHDHHEHPSEQVDGRDGDHDDHHSDHDSEHAEAVNHHEQAVSSDASAQDLDYRAKGLQLGNEVTLLLVRFASPLAALTLPREVNAEPGLQAASPPFEITRLLQIVGVGVGWLNAFAIVLVIGAALSIFAALYSSLHARRHDLAVLRCLGAGRDELFYLLFVEGLVLTVAGIVVGLLFAHAGMEVLGQLLDDASGIAVSGRIWVVEEFVLVGGLILVGSLTAMLPAWQAYTTDVARTLSAP